MSPTVVVAGGHVVEIFVAVGRDDGSIDVTWSVDGRTLGPSAEPAWRGVRFGVSGDEFYWWSARHVVTTPLGRPEDHVRVDVDDDEILVAFRRPGAWVLVCETSVQLVADGRRSRFEVGEVLVAAAWADGDLVVTDFVGRQLTLAVDDGEMRLVGGESRDVPP